MKKLIQKKNRGFTLVETMVAVSIFTVSLLGMMNILSGNISNTFYAKQKMLAAYLAQEGIEYIRNLRDTYVLYSTDGQTGWDAFYDKLFPCASSNGCYFNADDLDFGNKDRPMTNLSISICNDINCSNGKLLFDTTTGKYGFAPSGTPSSFIRKINVSSADSNEIKISSVVSWTQGSGNYSIAFSETLFNWIE